jgi:hypothetical protein
MAHASDRRIGIRIDLEVFFTQYIRDRPYRVLTQNLSETGLYYHRVSPDQQARLIPAGTPIGLEIALPGTGEVIWARGEVCRETWGRSVCGSAIRFADMPRVHARMVREFCHETRIARLDALLARVRRPRPPVKFPQIVKSEPVRRVTGDYRVPPPPSRRPV